MIRALDVDVPSDSEDERFDTSDDSDADPDYKAEADPATDDTSDEEEDDDDEEEELTEVNKPSSLASASDKGPGRSARGEKRTSRSSRRAAKMMRAEWKWTSADIPHVAIPDNNFTIKGNFSAGTIF